jgi:hypothetical protein
MGDDRINASIEGKAGVGGEVGAKLKIFGFEIADWRTYFDIGPQWTIFKFPDDGSGSSGNYDPNKGGGGSYPYPFEAEMEEKYKDYNYIPLAGSPVTWTSCGYENLFNGKTSDNSWEPFNDNDDKVNGVWFVEFKSKRPITPIKYYMTTSFNASYYPENNPKSWKLYAKANASDSWTTIATVTNDNRLSGNEQRFEYPLSVTGRQWQYFRLEVSENHGGSRMQFTEFEFDEYTDYNYIPLAGTGDPGSYWIQTLFDGTDWMSRDWYNRKSEKQNGVWYAEFESKRPITPTKYYMTTFINGNNYPKRNPKSWKVYAKARKSDSWTTIATVTDDNRLPADSHITVEYPLSVKGRQWQYFRLEISENHGDYYMELGEFEFDEK